MARKKSAKTARTSAARRIESLWQDARGAFRSAESQARKRVTAFARRNGVDTQELVERAQAADLVDGAGHAAAGAHERHLRAARGRPAPPARPPRPPAAGHCRLARALRG